MLYRNYEVRIKAERPGFAAHMNSTSGLCASLTSLTFLPVTFHFSHYPRFAFYKSGTCHCRIDTRGTPLRVPYTVHLHLPPSQYSTDKEERWFSTPKRATDKRTLYVGQGVSCLRPTA